jgi:hypothetical protein
MWKLLKNKWTRRLLVMGALTALDRTQDYRRRMAKARRTATETPKDESTS